MTDRPVDQAAQQCASEFIGPFSGTLLRCFKDAGHDKLHSAGGAVEWTTDHEFHSPVKIQAQGVETQKERIDKAAREIIDVFEYADNPFTERTRKIYVEEIAPILTRIFGEEPQRGWINDATGESVTVKRATPPSTTGPTQDEGVDEVAEHEEWHEADEARECGEQCEYEPSLHPAPLTSKEAFEAVAFARMPSPRRIYATLLRYANLTRATPPANAGAERGNKDTESRQPLTFEEHASAMHDETVGLSANRCCYTVGWNAARASVQPADQEKGKGTSR